MEMFFLGLYLYTNSNSRAGIIPCLISDNFCRYYFPFPRSMIGIGKLPAGILFPQATSQTTYHFLTDRQQIITVYIKLPAVRIVCIVE